MDAVVDRQWQYSRRSCLLVHGTVEETVKNTDEKIINTLRQEWMKRLNLRIMVDHTELVSLSAQWQTFSNNC